MAGAYHAIMIHEAGLRCWLDVRADGGSPLGRSLQVTGLSRVINHQAFSRTSIGDRKKVQFAGLGKRCTGRSERQLSSRKYLETRGVGGVARRAEAPAKRKHLPNP